MTVNKNAMKHRVLLALTILLLVVPVPAAADSVVGSPDIDLSAPDNHVEPGQRTVLGIFVTNSGDVDIGGPAELETQVQTARNVQFTIPEGRINAPIDVRTGTIVVDTVPPGGISEPLQFTLEVGESIEPGTYKIPVNIEYDYTSSIEYGVNRQTKFTDFSRERTEYVTIVVEEDARFRITSETSEDAFSGDTGMLRFDLRNTGSLTGRNARVTLTSGNPSIFFGNPQVQQQSTTVLIAAIEPGQTHTITTQFGARGDTVPGTYPVTAQVTYTGPNGVDRTSNPLHIGVEVEGSNRFAVQDVESNLRVGDDGILRGEIKNRGSTEARNVVVQFQRSATSNLNPIETEYAVGDLAANESKQFSFRIGVSSQAEEGSRLLSLNTRYRNFNDDVRIGNTIDVPVEIGRELKTFSIEPVDGNVSAGSGSDLRLRISNNQNQTLTNIQARMFTDSPLSSGDDEAFIPRLEPGESTTILMDISASAGATPKMYSVSMDFSYDDERNETKVTDSYLIPIEVTESSGGGLPLIPILIVIIALGAVGYWWRNRE